MERLGQNYETLQTVWDQILEPGSKFSPFFREQIQLMQQSGCDDDAKKLFVVVLLYIECLIAAVKSPKGAIDYRTFPLAIDRSLSHLIRKNYTDKQGYAIALEMAYTFK